MDVLFMKKVSAIDLIDSVEKAKRIISQPCTSQGMFREVWVGNYAVLKKGKEVPGGGFDISLGGGEMNRRENQVWTKYNHLNLLAKINWVSTDNLYLSMEKLNMDEERKNKAIKDLFGDFWVDEGDEKKSAANCLNRVKMVLWALLKANYDKLIATSLLKANHFDRKVNLAKVELKKEIYRKLLQLPKDVVWDLHYSNWGLDHKGELKILDYAGV
jgi:hypothetical protein